MIINTKFLYKLPIFIICFTTYSQIDILGSDFAKINRIKELNEYMVVPETNPQYHIEPIGLMIEKTYIYNEDGKIIKTICHECDYRLHSDKKARDLINEFNYIKNDLKKINQTGIDSSYTDFYYNKNKSLSLKQTNIDKRKELSFIHNSETKTTIVFNSSRENDLYAYIYREKTLIDSLTTFKKIFRTDFSVKIDQRKISILKKLTDINLIEETLLSLDFKECILLEENNYHYYKNGNMKKKTEKRGQFTNITNYSIDNNGFLISATKTKGYYSFESKYLYKYY